MDIHDLILSKNNCYTKEGLKNIESAYRSIFPLIIETHPQYSHSDREIYKDIKYVHCKYSLGGKNIYSFKRIFVNILSFILSDKSNECFLIRKPITFEYKDGIFIGSLRGCWVPKELEVSKITGKIQNGSK